MFAQDAAQPRPGARRPLLTVVRRAVAVVLVGLAGCAATSLTASSSPRPLPQLAIAGGSGAGGAEPLLRVPGDLPTPSDLSTPSPVPTATPAPISAVPAATLPPHPYYSTSSSRPKNAPKPYHAPVRTAAPAPPPGPVYSLLVPTVHQDHALDCESAALSAALQYVGIDWTQDQVLASLPVDTRAVVQKNGWPVQWGNPYEDFVGNVDGSEEKLTGYGVYDTEIAAVAQQAGAQVTVHNGWTLAQLVQQLSEGSPVVVWVPWHLYPAYVTSFTSWDGQTIWFSKSEHAQVLVGYNSNSGTITLMDPWDGDDQVYPASTFMTRFNAFDAEAVALSPPAPPTASASPTVSPSPTASASPTTSAQPSPTLSPSPTASPTASTAPSDTASPVPSTGASPSPDSG